MQHRDLVDTFIASPSGNGWGVIFLKFGTFFKVQKNWVVSICLGEISIFKIMTIDDVTFEPVAEKWPFSAGGLSDRFDLLIPLWSSVFILVPHTEYV